MVKDIWVDPELLHVTSGGIGSAGLDYAADALLHRDGLFAAVSQWRGAASRRALEQAAAQWELSHTRHLRRVGDLGLHVSNAALDYTADTHSSSDAMTSIISAIVGAVTETASDLST